MKVKSVNLWLKRRQALSSRRRIGDTNRPAGSSWRRLVLEKLESRELLTLPPSYLGDMRVELSISNELAIDNTLKSNHRTISSYTVPLLSNPSEIRLIHPGNSLETGGLITTDERFLDHDGKLAVSHGGYVGTTEVFDNLFGLSVLQGLNRLKIPNSASGPSVGIGSAYSVHNLRLTPLPSERLPAGTPIEISVLAMLESIDRAACGLSGCHSVTAGSQLEIIANAQFVSPQGTKSFSFNKSAATAAVFFDLGGVNVETVVGTTATLQLRNLIRGNLVLDSERRNSEVSLSAIHALPIQNVALAGGEIQWRSYEEGGGIEYTYFVLDELPPDRNRQVNFYWARSEDRSGRDAGLIAMLQLTSDGRDADGKPMLEPGMHRVVIPHEDFLPGRRSPDRHPGEPVGNFLHADLIVGASERIVRKHVASAVPSLVVNVLIHGWRPPNGGSWEDFTGQFREIAAYYGGAEDWFEFGFGSGLARTESLLHHRVHSVAPQWESDTNFTNAVGSLAISKLYESYASITTPLKAAPALLLAWQFRNLAERQATGSRTLAKAEAHRIAEELIGGPLSQDRDQSNAIQRIQVIGHSRGAAVGAMVTDILARRGYHNIVNFTSLDGFSTDWPDDAGRIGDADIASLAVASEKFNYRVDMGLTQFGIDGFLELLFEPDSIKFFLAQMLLSNVGMTSHLHSLDFRAPDRTGYWNSTLREADGSFTNHITITPAFLESAAACGTSTYINLNWFGRRCGLAPAGEGEASSTGSSSSAGEGEHGIGSHSGDNRQVRPLLDGDFESLGELLRSLQDERDALDGTDEYLIAGYDYLLDASMQLAATWYTEGTPTAVLGDAGTRARLRSDDSISQLVDYDKPLAAIAVRGKVPRINQGSLEILLDDKPIRVIPFSRGRGAVNETIRVGDGMKSDGRIQVRVRGPGGTDVEVELDSISVRAHHSWHRFSNPTDVNGDGVTNPLDALTVLNEIARSGAGPLRPLGINTFPFVLYDVNDDGEITPIDALMVLNWLARQQVHGEGEEIREVTAEAVLVSGCEELSRTFSSADRENAELGIGVLSGVSAREYPGRSLPQLSFYDQGKPATFDELLSATDSWQSESDDLDVSLPEKDWGWIRSQIS